MLKISPWWGKMSMLFMFVIMMEYYSDLFKCFGFCKPLYLFLLKNAGIALPEEY